MLELFYKGGFVSWILLVLSVITVTIILTKIIYFLYLKINNTNFVGTTLQKILQGNRKLALEKLRKNKHPIAKTMFQTIAMYNKQTPNIQEEIQTVGFIELNNMKSYLSWLDVISHIAPMIGLLGTVIGMIKAFRELSVAGSQVDISMLSAGIWEALITTALGLIISIIALIAVNFFDNIVEKTRESMSLAINKLLNAIG